MDINTDTVIKEQMELLKADIIAVYNASGKICKTCEIEKKFEDFYKHKLSKDGCNSECKLCTKKRSEIYRIENKEKVFEGKKRYREENKEKLKVIKKNYHIDNREYLLKKHKEYYSENKEMLSVGKKEWNKKNKEQIKEYNKNYRDTNKIAINEARTKRKTEDPLFKLSCNIRELVRKSIKNKGYTKSSKSTEILGASFEDVLIHLNNNPYGFVYGDEGLDIDHIIALATAKSEGELIKLNHYTNLQLLPSEYNRWVKSDSTYNIKHFENWYSNYTNNNTGINYIYNGTI